MTSSILKIYFLKVDSFNEIYLYTKAKSFYIVDTMHNTVGDSCD